MLQTGMFLGERYEVVGQIGTGGMADVYKGKDHKLNRFVAIKALKYEFREDTTFISKFQVEAQSAAGLIHPNIVSVYDVGEENGAHYIVMELVDGITLKEYIGKKGRLEFKEAISIAIQVCMGIEAAHKNGIIHRDIKPHNIMISKEGKVKVTDFGIARATSSNTISSNAMGSVHYTSPEQARGGYSDAKSDVYSLGITIFEMVTGRVPFDGDTTVAIAIKHLQEEITPPSEYVQDIPNSLEQIIIKCTQKSADRRYASMEEVIKDLKRSLVDPDGEFVNLIPIGGDSPTIALGEDDLSQIKQTTGTVMFNLDEEEAADDFDEDGEEFDEEEDDEINSKIGRVMKVLRIVMAVIIACIVLFLIGKASGLFASDEKKEEDPAPIETEKKKVPNLVGSTQEEARKDLRELGLVLYVSSTKSSDKYEEGVIMDQDPDEGTELEEGDTVKVVVSTGKEEQEEQEAQVEKVSIPDVSGYSTSEAKSALEAKGFKVSVKEQYHDSVKKGKVIYTDPGAGKEREKGTTIAVYVSKGPEDKSVSVPDVLGKTEEKAKAALEKAGLKSKVKTEYNDSVSEGKVFSQDPAGGSSVDAGTTVTLTVSLGTKPVEDLTRNFVGYLDGMNNYEGEGITVVVVAEGKEIFRKSYSSYNGGGEIAVSGKFTTKANVNSIKATATITSNEGGTLGTKTVTMTPQ